MSPVVFVAVLGAAMLHALWNALVKGGADKHVGIGAVVLGHVPPALIAVAVAPLPDPASLPYIAASLALHQGYQIFLLHSYRIGDLTHVYPIARGSAPLIVALVSALGLGVTLLPLEQLGIAVIVCGILSLSLVRRADGLRNPRAAVLALVTGTFIAGYSLVDGLGARAAGTSLGFFGWEAIGGALIFSLYLRLAAPGTLTHIALSAKRVFAIGGSASFAAYAIVTWGFTQAPIALVTALRETSIIFALLIGVVFLKERLDMAKLASTVLTVLGAVLVRFARS